MDRIDSRLWIPIALSCVYAPAHATRYLTIEQAQRVLFPQAEVFSPLVIRLTDELRARLRADDPSHRLIAEQKVWAAKRDGATVGHILIDEVIGKHERITYAVGIDRNGVVIGVEILDYRESRGGEVRDPRWRAQFKGKSRQSALRLEDDIQNISGATLSCRHITDGVRRLLALHEATLIK